MESVILSSVFSNLIFIEDDGKRFRHLEDSVPSSWAPQSSGGQWGRCWCKNNRQQKVQVRNLHQSSAIVPKRYWFEYWSIWIYVRDFNTLYHCYETCYIYNVFLIFLCRNLRENCKDLRILCSRAVFFLSIWFFCIWYSCEFVIVLCFMQQEAYLPKQNYPSSQHTWPAP